MRVLLAGQKWFGLEVYRAVSAVCDVACVSAPAGDRLYEAAGYDGVAVIRAGGLSAHTMPDGIDLIIAAHSYDFISERTRMRARWGGIGYHPSLLPIHRGRDSVAWAIRMGDRVTGGTVYRLTNKVDGGPILEQRHVLIRPGDTPTEIWRRDLAPLGVELLTRAVARHAESGFIPGADQNEECATWEPSIGRPPIHRPDLIMLPGPGGPLNG